MGEADFHRNYDHMYNCLGLSGHRSGNRIEIPASMGKGGIRRIVPRPDMCITITELQFSRRQEASYDFEPAMVTLAFCLEGKREVHASGERLCDSSGYLFLAPCNLWTG